MSYEQLNDLTEQEFKAQLEYRLPSHQNPVKFLQTLNEFQTPCPWGDLTKKEGVQSGSIFRRDWYIEKIPLALALGAGHTDCVNDYKGIAQTLDFGQVIFSDELHPDIGGENYVYLDLTNPAVVNLFGYQVHAIISKGVFTYAGAGVEFPNHDPNKDIENKTAKAISDMLMPGGIIANDRFITIENRFENILLERYGFRLVDQNEYSIILQKPF